MLPRESLDHIRVAFGDHRLVANAGLMLLVDLSRAWVCPNWSGCTSIWAMSRAGPTRATN